METIKNVITDCWDSLLGRVAIIGLSVGWVPFVLLSEAHAALVK